MQHHILNWSHGWHWLRLARNRCGACCSCLGCSCGNKRTKNAKENTVLLEVDCFYGLIMAEVLARREGTNLLNHAQTFDLLRFFAQDVYNLMQSKAYDMYVCTCLYMLAIYWIYCQNEPGLGSVRRSFLDLGKRWGPNRRQLAPWICKWFI